MIESAAFPYKTALSKVSVKTNEWGLQKRPAKKNGVLELPQKSK